jgi:hypothetical protein
MAYTAHISHEDLFCAGGEQRPLAIVVLNQPQHNGLLATLWRRASLKVFADGAGTRMFRGVIARLWHLWRVLILSTAHQIPVTMNRTTAEFTRHTYS